MVEWVEAKQLTFHINSNNLDNPLQSAYKPEHSYCLLENGVQLSLARGEPTALVLLNFLAAFGTIDHDTFLGDLKS